MTLTLTVPGTVPAPVPAGTEPVPVPVAFLGRTSTMVLQDPAASLRRQLGKVTGRLPAGWFIAVHFWDIESGGLDLEARGRGTGYDKLDIGIPRDGGLADLLAEAASPQARFAVVMCEDISRASRDTYSSLRLEKQLTASGIPLVASDEPIDAGGMTATTLLLRRMKQSVAEWYRFETKAKASAGFAVHSRDGYNIGVPPYGYRGDRRPHPVPSKAAQGQAKTRLVPDPRRAAVVAQVYAWRAEQKLGLNTIAQKLNADPLAYPPPGKAGCWQPSVLARILANPKYTGYMVYGRTRTAKGQRGRPAPRDQWLWSDQPAHEPIVSRELWDAAQGIGKEHGTSRDSSGMQKTAAYNYPLRGVIRCRICKRRMTGRRTYGRKGQPTMYYTCTFDPANPRHKTAHPDHPATVQVREDVMLAHLARFFDTRVLGPHRAELLAEAMPATDLDAARRRDADIAEAEKRLRQVDASEDAHAREIEHLATLPPDSPAVTALRTRLLARFTELEDERATLTARLDRLTATVPAASDPGLLDLLPLLPGLLGTAPATLQLDLYRIFSTQMTYNPSDNQVSCQATISHKTPHALNTLLEQDGTPASTNTSPASSPFRHATPTTAEKRRCSSARARPDATYRSGTGATGQYSQ
jgi:site-specific DNA recombinase